MHILCDLSKGLGDLEHVWRQPWQGSSNEDRGSMGNLDSRPRLKTALPMEDRDSHQGMMQKWPHGRMAKMRSMEFCGWSIRAKLIHSR
jgi:hypothetical protein